jgi:hypothetical protein
MNRATSSSKQKKKAQTQVYDSSFLSSLPGNIRHQSLTRDNYRELASLPDLRALKLLISNVE